MTRWQELPDDERGTGRTTRMLQEVVKYLEANPVGPKVVVVVAHASHVVPFRKELLELGADLNKVDVEPVDFPQPGRRLTTKYFWDHYAVDEWERWQISKITEKADRIRAGSSQSRQTSVSDHFK